MKHTHDEPYDASTLTLRVDSEEKSDGVDEGFRRYNDILAALGYTPDHREDGAVGGGIAFRHRVLKRTH